MIEKLKQYKKFIAALIGTAGIALHEGADRAVDAALNLNDGVFSTVISLATAVAVAILRNADQTPDADLDEGADQDDYVAQGE